VTVSYSNIERTLGFSVPVQYVTIHEQSLTVGQTGKITELDVTNTNTLLRVVCEILYINGVSNVNSNSDFSKYLSV